MIWIERCAQPWTVPRITEADTNGALESFGGHNSFSQLERGHG
jgi:hypothetical protein